MKVMLDTNIWSRLYDRGLGNDFAIYEEARGLHVVLPPATLLEALRTPRSDIRAGIVEVMVARKRTHLSTEAKLEAGEVVSEARRLRPGWVRSIPLTGKVGVLDIYWTKRLWQQAKANPDRVAEILLGVESMEGIRHGIAGLAEHERSFRRRLLQEGWLTSSNDNPLVAPVAFGTDSDPRSRLGWDGEPIELWRIFTAELYWQELTAVPYRARSTGESQTIADWALPYLDARAITKDRASWNRFFFYEVDPGHMPRNWLRTAVRTAQLTEKVGKGNPADEQHASYLPDVDVFLSGDVRYVRILEQLREFAPVTIARSLHISPDVGDFIRAIDQALFP